VAVPIAKDQHERIRRCTAARVAVAAPLDDAAIGTAALALWRDDPARAALAGRAVALGLTDGVRVALDGIAASLHSA